MKAFYFIIILLHTHAALAQDIDYAKEIVKKLSSKELSGRGYVENGDKLAAEYISGEFEKLGLKPLNKKSWYQKFHVSINTLPGELSVKLNGLELIPAVDYLVESSSPSINGKFKLHKISRKDIETEEKLISTIRKATDSFVFIDNTDKSQESKEVSKTIDEYIRFLKYSDQITFKGIVIYQHEKLTWDNSTFQNGRPVVILKKETNIDELAEIELIVENKFIPKYETQNVVGQIKGSSNSDSSIVLTAHYDHLGKMGKNVYFPGANDNASGIAMLLNLAKHYSQNKPRYNTVFIALAAEEIGLLGAKAFTENPLIDLKKIKFLVNFDLAGTGEEGIRIVNGTVFKDKFDFIVKTNTEQKLLPKIDIRGEACNSDHCMFYMKKVPCFYIYTQGGIQAYHDIDDKYETLPLTEFADYFKLMILFLNSI